MIVYVVLKNCRHDSTTRFNIFKGVYTDLEKAYNECERLCKRDYHIFTRYPKEIHKNVKRYEDVVFNGDESCMVATVEEYGESCIVATVEGHMFKQGYSSTAYHIRKVVI